MIILVYKKKTIKLIDLLLSFKTTDTHTHTQIRDKEKKSELLFV
jgi:hypothetical protein